MEDRWRAADRVPAGVLEPFGPRAKGEWLALTSKGPPLGNIVAR